MNLRLFIVALAAVTGSVASAATFNVTNPAEFQSALTTAQSNGEPDTINVAAGFYDIAASGTLTYTAPASENAGLTIFGDDSTTVILDGGSQVPILRIDTTQVINDSGVSIEVYNMTFQNGNAPGTPANGGALAITTDESQQPSEFATMVWIGGSEFYGNRASGDGGAVYIRAHAVEGIYLDDLTFDHFEVNPTTFVSNQAGSNGGNAYVAGGLFTTPIFFQNIDFFRGIAAGSGGGLAVEGFDAATPSAFRASSVSFFDIDFYGNQSNSATGGGGGADVAALSVFSDTVGFVDNTAQEGGGLRIRPNWGGITMVNTGFAGNQATADGGGMAVRCSFFNTFTVTNNTFFDNEAGSDGGGLFVLIDSSSSIAEIYNNIIYGNTAVGGTGDDLYVNNLCGNDIGATTELFNNDITDFDIGPVAVVAGSNIDAPPQFVAIDARPLPDPRLEGGSPAIDTGDNTAPGAPVRDFEGDARPFDGDTVAGAVIDIGMDEFTGDVPLGADVGIAMTDSPDPVLVGGEITYSITVTNNGPGDVTGVNATLATLPLTAFVSATVSQGSFNPDPVMMPDGIGEYREWTVGDIANGATATATIVMQHIEGSGDQESVGGFARIVEVPGDTNPDNDLATTETTVVPPSPDSADLAIVKVDTPDPVISGGPQLDFDITVTNNGPDAATGVTITDVVPVELTIVEATADDCVINGLQVICTIGDLAVDAEETVTITVLPEPVQASTDIDNTATVTGNEVDPVPGNNSSTATTTVLPPESDMMITVVATPPTPSVGETVTYDISVMNGGPSDNLGVDMLIKLPTMGSCQSASISQGSCGPVKGGVISCMIGDMLSGATVTAQVVCTAPGEAANMVLSASTSGSVADPAGGNNTDSDAVSVIEAIDIVIQGKSKGTGAMGWLELLFIVAAVIALRSMRTARLAVPCVIAAVAALMLVPAGSALAQGDFYVRGAFGQTELDYSASDLTSDLASYGWVINNPVVDSDKTAFKVLGGFRFDRHTGIEVGYVSLGEVMTQFGATVAPTEVDDILADTYAVHPFQGDGWVLAGVVTWPVNPDKFSVNLKLGAFAWESETHVRVIQGGSGSISDKDSGTDGMYGFGVEWKLYPNFALTAEWERYKMNEWLSVPFIGVKVSF